MNALRPNFTKMPDRIKLLPIDPERGYPVPWFVKWIDDKPEFRLMDEEKWIEAIKRKRCWVCGQRLGVHLCFVLGPMCGVTRTTSEPPCHQECARWSALNCPFLLMPKMVRREDEEFLSKCPQSLGGIAIKRNPGVTLLWSTYSFEVWRPKGAGILITVGPPMEGEWYAEGKPASWSAVNDSVVSGLPYLEEVAREEEGALAALYKEVEMLKSLYPAR